MNAHPGATVLICDDSISTRDLTTGWLRSEGYHVLEAGTGAEALLVMSEHTVDAVVLGAHLPDISVLDLSASIKADVRTSGVPVLHASAAAVEPRDGGPTPTPTWSARSGRTSCSRRSDRCSARR